MLKRYFKIISVFCLLVAIISQSFAAVRPSCEKMHPDTPMIMQDGMDSMEHAHHATSPGDVTINSSQAINDCCEEQACSMASCFSLPAIVVATGLQVTTEFSKLILPDYRAVYAGVELVSPYRPPIFR